MGALEYLGDFVKNSNAKNYRLGDKMIQDKNALMIMSEHDEVANQLIDEKVGKTLLALGTSGMLHELHITDQQSYNAFPMFFRVVFQIPKPGDELGNEQAF